MFALAADSRYTKAIAQHFIILRLAQAAAALARCAEPPAGWLLVKVQHRRRALHTLAVGTAPRGARTLRRCELQLCSSPVCAPGDRCVAVAMSPQDGTRLPCPSFHLIPEQTRPPPASTSRALRGRPTTVGAASRGAISRLVAVETPGQSRKASRHNRERTRSERWPSLIAVTVFSIFAEPALPVLRCQEVGDLRRSAPRQGAVSLECGNSTDRYYRYHAHLTREPVRATGALTRTTDFYNTTERPRYSPRILFAAHQGRSPCYHSAKAS